MFEVNLFLMSGNTHASCKKYDLIRLNRIYRGRVAVGYSSWNILMVKFMRWLERISITIKLQAKCLEYWQNHFTGKARQTYASDMKVKIDKNIFIRCQWTVAMKIRLFC